jgi:gliding motility-associated-like protein
LGGSQSYSESGLEDGTEVCYLVETFGAFCVDGIADEVDNFSNEICHIIKDTVPPCEPVVSIDFGYTVDQCEDWDTTKPLANIIRWENQFDQRCDSSGIYGYYIWFQDSLGGEFVLLDSVVDPSATSYVHDSIPGFAGCYAVTVKDIYGNESKMSEAACNENCEYFELPNVFTPNGDLTNDLFVPLPIPRFVESVEIWIYNRWGKQVWHEDENVNIEWPGVNENGDELSDGIYYYYAEVTFYKFFEESTAPIQYKGWIYLVR